MDPGLAALRRRLDAALIGQDDAKTGLALALLAREHAYLEGPPGCGKSRLAHALAAASGARCASLHFHRDIGERDLLGDTVLRRRRLDGGERLEREISAGPLLAAEVAVLDDLSRAPGEALGPLLRILSERRALGRALPLETAVATALPPWSEVYADPLEPNQLDRFAIQIRMRGLLAGRHWARARELLEDESPADTPGGLDRAERLRLQRRAAALPLGRDTLAGLLRLAARLRALAAPAGTASEDATLLTDRAFLRAAPAILRAHALYVGRERVEPLDLTALRYMLARRVPEPVLARLDELIDEALEGLEESPARPGGGRPGEAAGTGGGASRVSPPAESSPPLEAALEHLPGPVEGRRPRDPDADVEQLLRVLEGRLERGTVDPDDDPGGQPRHYRRLRRLDEILDADPLEALLFAHGRLPGSPHVYRRERRTAGGTLAVLRDVSASMEGRLSRWAGQVVAGLVHTAARRRMRVGYLEFNHRAERYSAGGSFFHRRYRRLLWLAARRRAEGRTSYEAPLRTALAEFSRSAGRNRHIVLLTDGVPVIGDPSVRHERALARRLGVKVHTVFLGLGDCPEVLDEISLETRGLRFQGRPHPGGRVGVREREETPCSTG
jgi:MoxR-like ATPase